MPHIAIHPDLMTSSAGAVRPSTLDGRGASTVFVGRFRGRRRLPCCGLQQRLPQVASTGSEHLGRASTDGLASSFLGWH